MGSRNVNEKKNVRNMVEKKQYKDKQNEKLTYKEATGVARMKPRELIPKTPKKEKIIKEKKN